MIEEILHRNHYDEIIEINKNVKLGIKTIMVGYRNNLVDYGEVLYKDNSIFPLGYVISASNYEFSLSGYFWWNENYIFKCHARTGTALSIFDINKRCMITDNQMIKTIHLKELKKNKIKRKIRN